ncbi:hypothetical protein F4802DRAFT_601119 [Xylaria palmicola]|nr:hypothetical protein F4802DRAFT_601119 [Xylaria palmicola]
MPLDRRRWTFTVQGKRQDTMSSNSTNPTVADTSSSSSPSASAAADSTTSSNAEPTSSSTSQTTTSSSPPPTTSTTSNPTTSTSTPPETTPSSTPEPTTSSTPPTSSTAPSSSTEPTSEPTTSSSPPPTTGPTTTPTGIKTTITRSDSTETTTITSIATNIPGNSPTTSASGTPTFISGGGGSSGSLDQPAKIAVAVVVPIAGVALIVLAGLFFWRKRKQRKDAEEARRKEVEDYSYNPNNDPTLPNVGGAGAYEMGEETSSGYRGWGSTTLAGSTGRKASTTMSGAGAAISEGTSPGIGNFSDTRSGEPLMSDGSRSPEGEILGAMGPATADNRGTNVHRGPSNASSSYSAAGRSDGSGENPTYGGPGYYDQYGTSNPYSDPYTDNPNGPVQPVIRDNPARRNTRIENPSHYPQQSAGISQNF